jgi:phage terminase small subunit
VADDLPVPSVREIRFCQHFADSDNAYRSYLAAGFEPSETDEATRKAASYLLTKPHISALVDRIRREALDAAQVTHNRVIQGLARIAFADRTEMFDEKGRVRPVREWPEDVKHTIEGEIEVEELFETTSKKGEPKRKELKGYARKIKTARRTEALKILAQCLRMIGSGVEPAKDEHKPLVVAGEADPGGL